MRYANVVFLQGSDEFKLFESVAYPDRKAQGVALGWPDRNAVMPYMIETYEHAEPTADEVFHDYRPEHPGKWVGTDYVETDTHVVAWHTGLCHAGLWRKIPTGTVYEVEVCNGTDKVRTRSSLCLEKAERTFAWHRNNRQESKEISLTEVTVFPDEHEETQILELA